jgi:hypothetical protein
MADKELSERLDRLENHFKLYKSDMNDFKDSLKEVRILLGGSALNGNKGFIKLMETIEEKVDANQIQLKDMQKDIDSVKFWGRGASGLLFASILVLINYVKDKL